MTATTTIAEMFTQSFAEQYGDIDMYNDYDDWCIAFCGPVELTDEGKAEFAQALELEVSLVTDTLYSDYGVIEINDRPDCEKMKKLTSRLFNGAAGYCSEENYSKWFKEV